MTRFILTGFILFSASFSALADTTVTDSGWIVEYMRYFEDLASNGYAMKEGGIDFGKPVDFSILALNGYRITKLSVGISKTGFCLVDLTLNKPLGGRIKYGDVIQGVYVVEPKNISEVAQSWGCK